MAAPGQVVTFTLTLSNAGAVPVRDLRLRDPLPDGLRYVPGSAPGAEYDPAGEVLAWRLAELGAGQAVHLSLAAQVTAPAGEELDNTATLQAGEGTPVLTATAAVDVRDAVDEAGVIRPETGGVLRSADERVEVRFPAGAVQRTIEASHRPLEPLDLPAPYGQHIFYRFELTAHQAGQIDLPVSTFARPVTVTVVYTDGEVEGLVEEGLRLVSWDEQASTWTPISTTVDMAANRLTAHLSHFSVYGASGDAEVFFQPRIEAGQVSLFTGDSSYGYELDVPAGAGGLQVPLTLQYSGGIPNSLIKPLIGADTNTDTGWVGVGWTLDVGRFEDELLTFNGLSTGVKVVSSQSAGTVSRCSPLGCTPGSAWCICESGSLAHRQQQTTNVQFYKIESDRFVGPVIESLDRVDVWTKDGTHYVFGSQDYVPYGTCTLPSGAQVQCGTGSRLYATRNSGARVYLAYKLDTIVDTHGNTVQIQYTVFPKPGSNHTQLKESYPSRILYTTNPGAGDNHAEYEIQFVVDKKAFTDKKADKKVAETGFYLKTVNVWFHYDPNDPANWETKKVLVRQYRFEYNAQLIASGTAYELASITQYAPDQAQHLPTTSFGYTPRTIGWRINEYLGGTWYTVSRRFLQTVDNGYGGLLTFGYQDWNCYDYASASEVGNEPFTCAAYAPGRLSWNQRQLVQSKSLSPGSGTPLVTNYFYDKADVKWTRNPPAGTYGCRGKVTGGKYETCFEQFIGFEKATEDWKSGSQTLKRTETRFHDTEGQPKIDQKKGKVEETWLKDGNGVLYTHNTTTFGVYSATGWPEGMQFVYASQVVEETCGDGGCQRKKTAYSYDLKWQNCGSSDTTQYGNVTRVEEYASDTAPTPYRTRLTGYCPNIAAWIVDKPAFENLYEGGVDPSNPSASQCRASTWYIYSDNQDTPSANWNQAAGSKGELRGVRRVLQWTPSWLVVDARYRHDAFGNVTQEMAYNSYGSDAAWASANPRATTTTYDIHHTFPVQVTGTTVGAYTPTEVREYYEVNESDTTGYGLPGQLKRVRDNNNQDDTWYHYDLFGRLVKEIQPGDSEANATLEYWYDPGYTYGGTHYPKRTALIREQSGVSGAVQVNFAYYDGLGRLVETLTERTNGGEQVLAYRTYDEIGQLKQEYVPYIVNSDFWSFKLLDPNQPRTDYTYDVLGRTRVVTHPDNTQTQHIYHVPGLWTSNIGQGSRQEEVVDANGHRSFQTYDAFGRLAWVGQKDDGGWCSALHVTLHGYDVAENLTHVASGGYICGSTYTPGTIDTWMTYDHLGRKTAMTDPDMGTWWYGYEAAGNLISQTDAVGQNVTFVFDALNRLTVKNYPSGSDVYYEYDASQGGGTTLNSWGRLRAVYVGSLTSNGHLYEYDNRGRSVKDTAWIDGSSYITQYQYDAMSRPVSMTYPNPGGETVTTSYNPQGLPATMSGSSSYVSNASYDALGRIELLPLGANGRRVDYVYYPWNQLQGQGRLQQIKTGPVGSPTELQDLLYTYDPVGNVLSIADSKVSGGTQTQSFAYDALDRLASASATGGSAGQGQYSESYTYDGIGNLTSKAGVSYTYPAAGSARPHAVRRVTGSGGTAKTVQIRAYSTPCSDGVRATMELWVNGSKQQTWTNVASTWTTYQQSVILSGNDQIEVVFTNDCSAGGYDRNLFVDYVVVDGRTIQAEGGAAIVDRGAGAASFDGLDVIAGQQGIYWNAALRFVVGPQASAACYDQNGNMTWRLRDGVAYGQTWDYDNRLATVTANGQMTTFVYDGNGILVKKVTGGQTTVYAGPHYERNVTTGQVTKYYLFNGQRLAMRVGSTLSYIASDHLGSSTLVLDQNGAKIDEVRYYPYGAERWPLDGAFPTDYRFTGQRIETTLQLYHVGARFYDPYLARWLSADALVPDQANPQSLNRYSWVIGNPLKYIDPTGHKEEEACPADDANCGSIQPGDIFLENNSDWKIPGEWDHAAIVVFVDPDRPNIIWIVEAGGESQVWMHSIDLTQLRQNAVNWAVIRPDTSQENREAAARWSESLAGWDGTAKRDITLGEAPFISMFPFKDSPWGFLDFGPGAEGYYCFEVAVDAYDAQGVDVTGRTQNLEMMRQVPWSVSSASPGGLTVSSYTSLSISYALTPVYGLDIYNSPNTHLITQQSWW
jgi:RHS repeat-associated protein/uncharacterized repeat protein (TIGR01451 family)